MTPADRRRTRRPGRLPAPAGRTRPDRADPRHPAADRLGLRQGPRRPLGRIPGHHPLGHRLRLRRRHSPRRTRPHHPHPPPAPHPATRCCSAKLNSPPPRRRRDAGSGRTRRAPRRCPPRTPWGSCGPGRRSAPVDRFVFSYVSRAADHHRRHRPPTRPPLLPRRPPGGCRTVGDGRLLRAVPPTAEGRATTGRHRPGPRVCRVGHAPRGAGSADVSRPGVTCESLAGN